MATITAHIEHLHSTIEPLKAELESERKKTKEMANKAATSTRDATRERETSATMRRQYESKLKVNVSLLDSCKCRLCYVINCLIYSHSFRISCPYQNTTALCSYGSSRLMLGDVEWFDHGYSELIMSVCVNKTVEIAASDGFGWNSLRAVYVGPPTFMCLYMIIGDNRPDKLVKYDVTSCFRSAANCN